MADKQLQSILSGGTITNMYIDGTTTAKKVMVREDVTLITNDLDSRIDVLESKNGFVDYNDLATSTTPISIPSTNTYVTVTNDGLGAQTLKTYLPSGITDIWNSSTSLFDFSQLSNGDTIDIRLVLEVTTTTPSQNVDVDMELGIGGFSYDVLFSDNTFKSAGTYQLSRYNGIYIGDDNTRLNGARFKIRSDGTATCKVIGWYCKINKR